MEIETTPVAAAETLPGERAVPRGRFAPIQFAAALIKYATNDIVSHCPSYTLRHAWYHYLLGWEIGPHTAIMMGQYVEMRGVWRHRPAVAIGAGTILNRGCFLQTLGGITVGENVSISAGVSLITGGHDIQDPEFRDVMKPIVIGNRVWIGAHATILGGVTIGENAIICAGALVRSDVRPNAVVDGVPGKVIGVRRGAPPRYSFDFRPLFE